MPTLMDLVLAYGLCFGAMNKVDAFHGKHAFLDAMLKCSYCTGFHAGWIAWAFTWPLRGLSWDWTAGFQAVVWAGCSAVFCYGVDTVLQLAESWIRKQD